MHSQTGLKFVRCFFGVDRAAIKACFVLAIVLLLGGAAAPGVFAQGNTSGGFKGVVRDKGTGNPIPGAKVVLRNQQFGTQATVITGEDGTFSKGSLPPGDYNIEVSANGYVSAMKVQTLYAMASYPVEPTPFDLEQERSAAVPTPTAPGNPDATPQPTPTTPTAQPTTTDGQNITLNPRRGGIFDRRAVVGLPLGGSTLTRTFDEHAFLIAGVNSPPQAIGNSVGPGIGGGVGTSGQFSVNGLRSRANNFTVDGSDNNDEDIGVRRQGFFTLVPQPIESIQEFQIITLLAPAEFGRNLGTQVNALSRSGGNEFHGTLYGFYNSDELNSRNPFDNNSGNSTTDLTGIQSFGDGTSRAVPVFVNGAQRRVTNSAGGKDNSRLLEGGVAIGGRLVKDKVFFFVSGEEQHLNATQERHFSVPTVEQRGFVGAGATGLQQCRLNANLQCVPGADFVSGFPTSLDGDYVFSMFPFANDPTGIYGRNTYSQELSADARGRILSGKIDWNIFKVNGNQQILTARYNYTKDRRDLTDVGGALFSAIRPVSRTDNFSAYLTGSLTDSTSNELRVSWGRTRLRFDEIRDNSGFLLPSTRNFTNPEDGRFLLNARVLFNDTIPGNCGPNGCNAPTQVDYDTGGTTENTRLGLIGQLNVAGFSPVGVDVFNFPQSRTNNTYQLADNLRHQSGKHGLTFGADLRRVFLESNLPRNSRPLVTFNGSPDGFDLCNTQGIGCNSTPSLSSNQNACGASRFCSPTDLASVGGASGFFQSLVLPGKNSAIDLRYNQLDFFAQDEWRISPKVTLSLGLRYEYNTTPKEADNKIESTFSQTLPTAVAQLSSFIEGRNRIYEPDRNNFAPRIGIAAELSPSLVVRGGFGIYYDQVLGAVVSQSRNVFPTFTTVNLGGGLTSCFDVDGNQLQCGDPATVFFRNTLFNPVNANLGGVSVVQSGTINTINPSINQTDLLNAILTTFPNFNFNGGVRVAGSPFGATLPKNNLDTPFSAQYSVELEKRLFRDTFLSVAFVGTQGRNLLRFSNPNLGSNYLTVVRRADINFSTGTPFTNVLTLDPTANPYANLFAGRPSPLIGSINRFETTGESRYDSAQIELRGRLLHNRLQYQMNYVYGKVIDDVSDVFDLAGSSALPQNSTNYSGEFAPANFDVRHRFTYNFIYDTPSLKDQNAAIRYLFGNWQIAGTGIFHTGQPFTVNSIYDVNLDGNLTDRLDNTQFLRATGDRQQPLVRTCASRIQCESMLAPFGQDGSIQRNSFRAGNVLDLDMSFSRRFTIHENQNLQFRVDFFNFIDRDNFGVPVRFLEAGGFGKATDTITPGRRIQFGVKYNF